MSEATLTIEELLAQAGKEELKVQPSRNDKYLPVIYQLTEKQFTAQQIKDWLDGRGFKVGLPYISNKRKLYREEKGMNKPEDEEEELQPVATTTLGKILDAESPQQATYYVPPELVQKNTSPDYLPAPRAR